MSRGRRGRKRRYGPALWVLAVLLGGLGANFYLALRPRALEGRLAAALREVFAAPFRFESFTLSWTGEAELERFVLEEPEGSTPCLRIGSLHVVPRLLTLLAGRFEPELLVLRDVEVRLRREPSGRWNFERLLLEDFSPRRRRGVRPPDLVLESCTVTYVREGAGGEATSEEFRDLHVTLQGEAPGLCSFRGEVSQDISRHLAVSGRLEYAPRPFRLDLRIEALKLDLGAPLDRFLPEELAGELRELRLQGMADVLADLHVGEGGKLLPARVEVTLVRAGAAPAFLPSPLEALSGSISLEDGHLELRGLEGTFAGAALRGEGRAELDEGSFTLERWGGRLELAPLTVDARLESLLSERAQEIFRRLRPRGRVALSLEVAGARGFPPAVEDLHLTAELEGVDLDPEPFPYPLRALRGTVELVRGRLAFPEPLEAACGHGTLRLAGQAAFPAGELDLTFRLGGRGVTLDETLRRALPPEHRDLWDAFQPAGSVTGVLELERDPAAGEPRVRLQAQVAGGRLLYHRFPYEVEAIAGEVRYTNLQDQVTLSGFEGRHGERVIRAEGSILPGEGFSIRLRSDDLGIDGDILRALPPRSRTLIDDFRFQGRLKAEVTVSARRGEKASLEAIVDILEGTILPRQFPYGLDLEAGRLRVLGAESVELLGFRTARREGKPQVELDEGFITSRGTRRTIKYRARIAGLEVGPEFVAALPEPLRRFVTSTGLVGTFGGTVEGIYAYDEEDPAWVEVHYAGHDVKSSNAAVDFGFKIKDMKAVGSFVGSRTPERGHRFSGRVGVDSAWFNRLHLTNGDIHFAFGGDRPIPELETGEIAAGRRLSLAPEVKDHLGAASLEETFQLAVVSNNLYGGQVEGVLFVDTGEAGNLGGQFAGRGLDLAKASRDIFGVEGRNVVGEASGWVFFTGRNRDLDSIAGRGHGTITEARLAELPLFFGILTLLNFNFGELGGTVFDEVTLPYTIEKGRFRSPAIEIRSPALTLKGRGTMDFAGTLDLALEPEVLPVKIPILDQLLALLKGALAWVRVTGDLASPRVEFVSGGLRFPIRLEEGGRAPPGRRLPSDLREGD